MRGFFIVAVLPFEKLYLDRLPNANMYEMSYMHRDVRSLVVLFIILVVPRHWERFVRFSGFFCPQIICTRVLCLPRICARGGDDDETRRSCRTSSLQSPILSSRKNATPCSFYCNVNCCAAVFPRRRAVPVTQSPFTVFFVVSRSRTLLEFGPTRNDTKWLD
jgi:hypothetical protein